MNQRGGRWIALLLLGATLGGCAWANRDNRPVWNAFEDTMVPEGDTAFYATLPLTVPAGLVAILLDTFIVHPATVVDEAWDDALDVWDDIDWEGNYYTEAVGIPIRAIGTPIVLVVSFLGRSMFDIREDDGIFDEKSGRHSGLADERLLDWLEQIGEGGTDSLASFDPPADWVWSDGLRAAWARTKELATAEGRLEMFRAARRHELPPWREDPWAGLRDPDAVVRYFELRSVSQGAMVPDSLKQRLLADSVESVRLLAHARWPDA